MRPTFQPSVKTASHMRRNKAVQNSL